MSFSDIVKNSVYKWEQLLLYKLVLVIKLNLNLNYKMILVSESIILIVVKLVILFIIISLIHICSTWDLDFLPLENSRIQLITTVKYRSNYSFYLNKFNLKNHYSFKGFYSQMCECIESIS